MEAVATFWDENAGHHLSVSLKQGQKLQWSIAPNSLEFLLSGRLFQRNDFSQCFNPLCQAISEPKTHIQKEPKLALTHAFSLIHTQNSAVQQTKAGRAPKITLAG